MSRISRPGGTSRPSGTSSPAADDDPAAPPFPADPGAVDGVPSPARSWVAERARAVPLGARMVALLCVVLLLGLTAAGLAALTLLGRSLVDQVDAQLHTYAGPLLGAADRPAGRGGWGPGADVDALPSDYYIELLDADGTSLGFLATADTTGTGTPDIEPRTAEEVAARDGVPFTVSSSEGGTGWRAVMLPTSVQGQYVTVVLALPLTGVERTLTQMRAVLLLVGAAVIALGSVAGWVAVRRSLRPLQEMETTAAAIAAGDLSRRVPLEPATTEVGRLGAALNVMLGQIEQAFAERAASEDRMRRFVADASHELRTPLATIRGYSELYRMGAVTTPEEIDDTVRRIEDSATRMGRLVEDLLHLTRLDEGRPLRAEPVDLTVLAADAVSDVHALDPGRPVRITPLPGAEGGLGPCVVVGDEDRLRQVLANLTGNVVQHTAPGTPVEIAVGRQGARAVLEVRDHGPGIAPEHAARVFERFYRVDTSRNRASGGGAGLGMAIVAAIVGAHQGSVRIDRTPGGGTTVRVDLPLGADPGTSDRPAPAEPSVATGHAERG